MQDTLCINSKSNEKVKFIKSLNEKKYRQKNRAYYLEGIKVVYEILIKKAIDILFIACSREMLEKTSQGKKILNILNQNEYSLVKKYNFSETVFNYMCDTSTPQGILVVLNIKEENLDYLINDAYKRKENILILDKIQDAGNLGTIIRTANAFNIKNIICICGTVDCYSQKVLRSTMGTILNTNIIYLDKNCLEDLKQKLNAKNFLIAVTTLDSNKYIDNLDYNKKFAFVLGNEANGVSKEITNISDLKIKIKIDKNVESLNVSIACGILLYEQYKNNK